MEEPIWINKPETLAAHSMQIAEHGGSEGIRDEGLLDSALGKPRNVFACTDAPSLPRLAASYAYGIARNHPFVDGNKRAALVVSEGFLLVNGLRIVAPPEEKYFTFLHLADGSLSEEELTDWFTQHAVPPQEMTRFKTTDPGYRNRHNQIVISRTGFASESFPGQTIYHLRCGRHGCNHDYGANGCDIHIRRCPRCQDGAQGEPLRTPPPNLFHP